MTDAQKAFDELISYQELNTLDLENVSIVKAALQRAEKVEWQSIETSPKDGTRIRVSCGDFECDAWWEDNLNSFIGMDADWNLLPLSPSSWMPLPALQKTGAPKDKTQGLVKALEDLRRQFSIGGNMSIKTVDEALSAFGVE